MRRHVRSIRRLPAIAAAVGLTATLAALIGTASVPAATKAAGSTLAAHKCLVMTGSGDPAFVKELQPVHRDGSSERRVRPRRVL